MDTSLFNRLKKKVLQNFYTYKKAYIWSVLAPIFVGVCVNFFTKNSTEIKILNTDRSELSENVNKLSERVEHIVELQKCTYSKPEIIFLNSNLLLKKEWVYDNKLEVCNQIIKYETEREIFIFNPNKGYCGSGGCSVEVRNRKSNKNIFGTLSFYHPNILQTSHNGHRDFSLCLKSYLKEGGFKMVEVPFNYNVSKKFYVDSGNQVSYWKYSECNYDHFIPYNAEIDSEIVQ